MAEQPALGFGGLLRRFRDDALLTQEELARAAGLSPRSVSDLERGINRRARKDTAVLLADALGLAEPVRTVFVAAALGRVPAAEVLAAARAGASPAAGGPAPGADPAWSGCPYLGLMPFQQRDARVFYGRDELVAQLLRQLAGRLDMSGILLIAGESGIGKSSLIRAGLLPQLAAGALGPGSQTWPLRVIQPTADPLRELAMQLADVAAADPVAVYRSLSTTPAHAPMLVEQAVRTTVDGDLSSGSHGMPPRLVLVVDQFEELFTAAAASGQAEREAYMAALHAAAIGPVGRHKVPSALVVAVVRADFLDRLPAYPPLIAALDAGPFTVGPMTEAELRLAITGPAAESGLAVEAALVEAVITELRDGAWGGLSSGVLPLLSQAMAATWERHEGSELTLRAYRRAGGIADVVNRGAQAAYDALTSSQKEAARLVFTWLTTVTPDGRLTRRPCSRADLRSPDPRIAADIDAVIDIFTARRLVVLGQDRVEMPHDVLLQAWKPLRDWLGEDQRDRVLYSQIISDAQTWDDNGREPSYLYWPGRLARIDAAAARWQDTPARYPPLPATSTAFLGAARLAARRARWRRRGVIVGLALILIAVTGAGLAVSDAVTASRQHAMALSRLLAAYSLGLASSDPQTAGRLAVAAWSVFQTPQAGTAVTTSLVDEQRPNGILRAGRSSDDVRGVAFSQDGQLVAAACGDGTVRVWNPVTGRAVATIPADTGPGGGVNAVAFSPDGKLLATADADGTVRLWNPATGHPARAPTPAEIGYGVNVLTVSPDGNLRAGAPIPPEVEYGMNAVAFSPNGHLLAAADADGTVRLWNPATGQLADAPTRAEIGYGVNAVAFSPDGNLLATADEHGTIRAWSLATGRALHAPPVSNIVTGSSVNAVTFSPDSKLLATGDERGNVRVWNLAGQEIGLPLLAGGGVNGVAFSPDGQLLATADTDGTVRTWQLSVFTDPYAALCARVGPPTKAEWARYAPGEPEPSVCR